MNDSLAAEAAESFVQAWLTGKRLKQLPSVLTTEQLFRVHLAIQRHPRIIYELGGLGGYKMGGIGAVPDEPWLYAPLFSKFIVPAPGASLPGAAIGRSAIEAEVAVIMGEDVCVRADGQPHTVDAVWSAVAQVVLAFEVCGKRGMPEAIAGASTLSKMADTMSSGGLILGPRLPAATVDAEVLRTCNIDMFVNETKVAEGAGLAIPAGSVPEAVAYLANHLNSRRLSLKKGDAITTGARHVYKNVKPGDRIRAQFSGFGTVEMIVSH